MSAAVVAGITAVFLLLAGERISRRIQGRRVPDQLAWIDDRIRTETDMTRRAAWRSLRRVMKEDEL